ncbi:hypothetical protein [Lacrimispora sp.]|uniref:hypothetical protein n=1 Tax=Lacrimispora sp. TaxID=2719234 RepID=UPI002897D26F|nr:hypothetical protein [Lacrimispora sp.]
MAEQKFGPRRCRDTRKPPAGQCPEVVFYRCAECRTLFPVTGEKALEEKEILCCGHKAERLVPSAPEQTEDKIKVSYQITGGYNDNAVQVFWKAEKLKYAPEWIYLKTFTGGYLKYVSETKRPPMVFALADTDAFAYCDEDPCLECVFRCKRGFVIYIYSRETGLVHLPLDKMTAHWQSGAKEKA